MTRLAGLRQMASNLLTYNNTVPTLFRATSLCLLDARHPEVYDGVKIAILSFKTGLSKLGGILLSLPYSADEMQKYIKYYFAQFYFETEVLSNELVLMQREKYFF